MYRILLCFVGWIWGFVVLCIGVVAAQDEMAESPTHQKVVTYLAERLNDQRLQLTAPADAKVTLGTAPIFRVNNPISGADGGVFVWVSDGKPVALSKSLLNSKKRIYSLTTVSLWPDTFSMTQPDGTIWEPKSSTLTPIMLTDEPPPTDQASKRLMQMKGLAESFSIEVTWQISIVEPTSVYVLRMLPRPIYRYTSERFGVVDGALFAFCQGTNPEAIVQVEAIRSDDGLEWRCGVSRLTSHALKAQYRKNEVLKAVSISNYRPQRHDNYFNNQLNYPKDFDPAPAPNPQ